MADKKIVKPKSPDKAESKADTGKAAERKTAVIRHRKTAKVSRH